MMNHHHPTKNNNHHPDDDDHNHQDERKASAVPVRKIPYQPLEMDHHEDEDEGQDPSHPSAALAPPSSPTRARGTTTGYHPSTRSSSTAGVRSNNLLFTTHSMDGSDLESLVGDDEFSSQTREEYDDDDGDDDPGLSWVEVTRQSRACYPIYCGAALVLALLFAVLAVPRAQPPRKHRHRPSPALSSSPTATSVSPAPFPAPSSGAPSLHPSEIQLAPLPPRNTDLACERQWTHQTNWSHLMQDMNDHPMRRCQEDDDPSSTFSVSTLPPGRCSCTNPVQPQARTDQLSFMWQHAVQVNQQRAQSFPTLTPDVVLIGDSITEHWVGREFGYKSPDWKDCRAVYEELFPTPNPTSASNSVSALVLGLAGDRCTHLLYRMTTAPPLGEVPLTLQPKIWWMLIGTNDLADSCQSASLIAGNIAVVEALLERHPSSVVVINSILPRGFNETLLSMDGTWQKLTRVNQALSCYADSYQIRSSSSSSTGNRSAVHFFNATDLFLRGDDPDRINMTLMADSVHPSAEGYRVWGRQIIAMVQHFLQHTR